jgi:hypothetical protein
MIYCALYRCKYYSDMAECKRESIFIDRFGKCSCFEDEKCQSTNTSANIAESSKE